MFMQNKIKTDQNGVLAKFLVKIQFSYTNLYRKPHFLIFARAHVIMTSQKPEAGHVGTSFAINVLEATLS